MSAPGQALPGFDSPAAGFEQPYDMLTACHERVQRTLALLERLIAHVDRHGHDTQSRSAAADVLRYFDLAAPLHHQDEELHVFPALLAGQDAALQAVVRRLQAEH
ncbi:MAG: hemerythrin domain-containing protein, partial [Curvibacter sp.]